MGSKRTCLVSWFMFGLALSSLTSLAFCAVAAYYFLRPDVGGNTSPWFPLGVSIGSVSLVLCFFCGFVVSKKGSCNYIWPLAFGTLSIFGVFIVSVVRLRQNPAPEVWVVYAFLFTCLGVIMIVGACMISTLFVQCGIISSRMGLLVKLQKASDAHPDNKFKRASISNVISSASVIIQFIQRNFFTLTFRALGRSQYM
eukprot:TRINITY_DN5398_c0_g1_i5.p1 TRINITY_DN5398_c0_g1~~TRINITY_DN5398_c0_g1_i5.p1  ORF type:complete len:198 (+),score=23.12 TRINITY_DN5398_c0_g1_i5:105-698(+)